MLEKYACRACLAMNIWLLWLAATGYALYYFASEAWLPLTHWIASLALLLAGLIHVRLGRRRALAAAAQPQHSQGLHVVATSYNPPAKIKARS